MSHNDLVFTYLASKNYIRMLDYQKHAFIHELFFVLKVLCRRFKRNLKKQNMSCSFFIFLVFKSLSFYIFKLFVRFLANPEPRARYIVIIIGNLFMIDHHFIYKIKNIYFSL